MSKHVPILKDAIVQTLTERWSERCQDITEPWIVDATFGGGGHTGALLKACEALTPRPKILAIDQDQSALDRGSPRFAQELARGELTLKCMRMSELSEFMTSHAAVGVLADLGFSSDQIEDPQRGLSFKLEGPLDFRLSQNPEQPTAWDAIQELDESELTRIIEEYGEDRFAKRISHSIKWKLSRGELSNSTSSLVGAVVSAIPPKFRHGRIHVATKTFQALRIHVNREREELDSLLTRVMISMRRGGRMAILTFHSGEDRQVKHWLKKERELFQSLSKKPLLPSREECETNPRARSAKLRVAEKVN